MGNKFIEDRENFKKAGGGHFVDKYVTESPNEKKDPVSYAELQSLQAPIRKPVVGAVQTQTAQDLPTMDDVRRIKSYTNVV